MAIKLPLATDCLFFRQFDAVAEDAVALKGKTSATASFI
jgi:hypothetical protein